MIKEKKQKLHKFEIRAKKGSEGKILVGANTEFLIDGVPMRGVTNVNFEVAARGIAKMTIEVIGNFCISAVIGDYEQVIVPLVPQKVSQK